MIIIIMIKIKTFFSFFFGFDLDLYIIFVTDVKIRQLRSLIFPKIKSGPRVPKRRGVIDNQILVIVYIDAH